MNTFDLNAPLFDEDHPLEAVLTIGGQVVLSGQITGAKMHREQHRCENGECLNNCLPDHFVVVTMREMPPTEPGRDQL